MADAEAPQEAVPKKKKSKLGKILMLVVMLALGGGGFYATYSGMILSPAGDHAETTENAAHPLPDIAFVPVEPLVVSLAPGSRSQHLRFTAQLEVASPHTQEVTLLLPRIMDVLNGYLRAIEVSELENPASLVRLRAQMLRRIQIVTGEGRVRDLLVTEFVLN